MHMLKRAGKSPNGDRERGAALIEFALIAPLLLLLLFGIIEFGWKFGQFNDVRHAAREAARYAAVDAGDNAAIRGVVCDSLDGMQAGITEVRVALTDGSSGLRGESASIRVEVSVDSLSNAPLISDLLPTQLASDIEFRLEQNSTQWSSEGLTVASC